MRFKCGNQTFNNVFHVLPPDLLAKFVQRAGADIVLIGLLFVR